MKDSMVSTTFKFLSTIDIWSKQGTLGLNDWMTTTRLKSQHWPRDVLALMPRNHLRNWNWIWSFMFSLCNICSYYLVINSKLVNALCIIMSWAKDNLINIIFISIECFTSSPLKHETLWILFNSSFFSPSQQSRENRHPSSNEYRHV